MYTTTTQLSCYFNSFIIATDYKLLLQLLCKYNVQSKVTCVSFFEIKILSAVTCQVRFFYRKYTHIWDNQQFSYQDTIEQTTLQCLPFDCYTIVILTQLPNTAIRLWNYCPIVYCNHFSAVFIITWSTGSCSYEVFINVLKGRLWKHKGRESVNCTLWSCQHKLPVHNRLRPYW